MLQFGKYRGQSFRWMLENALGYVGWFVDNIRNERATNTALKKYVESFEEGRHVVALKKKQREDKEAKIKSISKQPSQSSPSKQVPSLAAGLASGRISSEQYLSKFAKSAGAAKFKPTIPVSKRKTKPVTPCATVTFTSTSTDDADDDELCAIADQVEKNLGKLPIVT